MRSKLYFGAPALGIEGFDPPVGLRLSKSEGLAAILK